MMHTRKNVDQARKYHIWLDYRGALQLGEDIMMPSGMGGDLDAHKN